MREPVDVVTGGLGYIGQSLIAELIARGRRPLAVDVRSVASQVPGVAVRVGSVADGEVWREIFDQYEVQTIFHCAGLIAVGESMTEPARYFAENVAAALAMLDHVRRWRAVPLVFSSSAAVYGTPREVPIAEEADKHPESPYGLTKWHFEQILESFDYAYRMPWMALRYFNAAGTSGGVEERHQPETHLLPRVADALAAGQRPTVYGCDHPTPDGSAVRDYVHVRDLVAAHIQAADYLARGGESGAVNLGSGRGTSVLEVIAAFGRVSQQKIDPILEPIRPGDPPVLVADIARARAVLGWSPRHSSIDAIVQEVWLQRGAGRR